MILYIPTAISGMSKKKQQIKSAVPSINIRTAAARSTSVPELNDNLINCFQPDRPTGVLIIGNSA